jgi:hypothetical protein
MLTPIWFRIQNGNNNIKLFIKKGRLTRVPFFLLPSLAFPLVGMIINHCFECAYVTVKMLKKAKVRHYPDQRAIVG